MAIETTRAIVPRADGESSVGRKDKYWGAGYFREIDTSKINVNGKDLEKHIAETDAANEQALKAIRASVGTPLIADSAAKMSDQNKIYVYVGGEEGYTAGHWYYWDGTTWTDGGVYNSTAFATDKTLTLEDSAADAKAAGERLSAQDVKLATMQAKLDDGVETIYQEVTLKTIRRTEQEHDSMREATRAEYRRAFAKEKELSSAITKNSENIQRVDDKYANVATLKPVTISDTYNNIFTDGIGQRITVNAYMLIVDTTLTQKDIPADAQVVGNAIRLVRDDIHENKLQTVATMKSLSNRIDVNEHNDEKTRANFYSCAELKSVAICDKHRDAFTDNTGARIVAQAYLPVTDSLLQDYGVPADAQAVGHVRDELREEKHRATAKDSELENALSMTKDAVQKLDDKYASAVTLKQVVLKDNAGNLMTDSANRHLTVGAYLPIVDTTLTQKDIPADAQAVGAVRDSLTEKMGLTFVSEYQQFSMPVLYLNGRIDQLQNKSVTLKNEVSYDFPYLGIAGMLSKVKVQGSSSVGWPKKNYTLTFDKNFEAKAGWGRHKKYVIKANYIDFSQARNVICARIWGQLRKTRIAQTDALQDGAGNYICDGTNHHILMCCNPSLSAGVNCGAIDGWPIMVVINNKYWGLYTFNSPKDDWMASMGAGKRECIVSTDYSSTQAEYFKGEPTMKPGTNGMTDFEIEYVTDEDDDAWVLESLKTMIAAVRATTGTNYKDSIKDYVDVDSAIDYMIFSALIGNTDGIGKNCLYDTFDGKKWYFCAYDLDNVFGSMWTGKYFNSPNMYSCTLKSLDSSHRMFHLIYTYDRDALIARYEALRAGVLSEVNIMNLFINFINDIPLAAQIYESLRWPKMPSSQSNTFDEIVNWYRLRVQIIDAEIAELKGYKGWGTPLVKIN